MVNVSLRGDVHEYENGVTPYQIAQSISSGLARVACAAKIDGEGVDLRTPIEKDCEVEILTFDDPYGKKAFWHTTSHVMAQAVLHLFPDAKFSIGPAIDNGFYYDFDVEKPFTVDDLKKIEEEMAKIIKTGLELNLAFHVEHAVNHVAGNNDQVRIRPLYNITDIPVHILFSVRFLPVVTIHGLGIRKLKNPDFAFSVDVQCKIHMYYLACIRIAVMVS